MKFCKYNSTKHAELQKMVSQYYKEDPPLAGKKCPMNIKKTISRLGKNPGQGQIYIFTKNEEIVGYAILIFYWSNEFAGNWLIIDELFVKNEYRGQQIATKFLTQLIKKRPHKCVGLQLEIHKANLKVKKLYEKLGFIPVRNYYMERTFTDNKLDNS